MPDLTVIDLAEQIQQLERENEALQKLRRFVAIDLERERTAHGRTRRRLQSCQRCLGAAATAASLFAAVAVILWLRGAV